MGRILLNASQQGAEQALRCLSPSFGWGVQCTLRCSAFSWLTVPVVPLALAEAFHHTRIPTAPGQSACLELQGRTSPMVRALFSFWSGAASPLGLFWRRDVTFAQGCSCGLLSPPPIADNSHISSRVGFKPLGGKKIISARFLSFFQQNRSEGNANISFLSHFSKFQPVRSQLMCILCALVH